MLASHVDDVAATVPAAVRDFLAGASSPAWATALARTLDVLLIDHANCELKAAATALSLIHRYPDQPALCHRMSRLAREELRHYEQVQQQMSRLGVAMRPLSASRYASGLRALVQRDEPGRLIDTLIIGALIEARSCERFALIAPLLPADLGRFYVGLLNSEARHFEHYLELARSAAGERVDVDARIAELAAHEYALIATPCPSLRFHSGPPERAETSR